MSQVAKSQSAAELKEQIRYHLEELSRLRKLLGAAEQKDSRIKVVKPAFVNKVVDYLHHAIKQEKNPVSYNWMCDTLNVWMENPMKKKLVDLPDSIRTAIRHDNRFSYVKDGASFLYFAVEEL